MQQPPAYNQTAFALEAASAINRDEGRSHRLFQQAITRARLPLQRLAFFQPQLLEPHLLQE